MDGLGSERSVRLVPYDPRWPASFEAARGDLAARFAQDRTSYVQTKEPIVEDLLITARAWREEMARHRGDR